MAVAIPQSHLDLFEKKSLAYLGVHLPRGGIQVTPVWCGLDGTHVMINSAEGRLKDRAMKANPAVTLCIADPDNGFRYLEVRGRVVDITAEGADAHIDQLAKRYLGVDTYPNRRPGEVRLTYKVLPEKVVTFGG